MDIMSKLSKEEKKAMIKNWKETQRRDYILTKAEAEKLLNYLDNILENTPCDNTLRFTKRIQLQKKCLFFPARNSRS